MKYPNATQTLDDDLNAAHKGQVRDLAERLIKAAQQFDMDKTMDLAVNFRMSKISRNQVLPQDYTHESVLGAPYADDEAQPLENGEKWHDGRRACNTKLKYAFNAAGHPINPYMNTGLDGRGVLGQFGPNHAVDNGILLIKDDEDGNKALHAIGILRKFDNDAPALSGGFAKYKRGPNGEYIFDKDAVIETQVEELFEEMISGSINLIEPYAGQLPKAVQDEYDNRMKSRNGLALSGQQKSEIAEQVKTGLKMKQVEDLDPEFLKRLHTVVATGHECFAGPVLNDNRNTNNAWIETQLSWFIIDEKKWDYIVGPSPKFNYEFSAGDDASGVVEHKISPNLLDEAFASHGALFTYLAASYLLQTQVQAQRVDTSIINQLSDVANFLENENGQTLKTQTKAKPKP